MRRAHAPVAGRRRATAIGGHWILALASLAACFGLGRSALAADDHLLDGFEDPSTWTATASPGASVELAQDQGRDGQSLRIDFDLGGGGFVIVRRPLSMSLPDNYLFTFDVRGSAQPNNLQLKLVDPSGKEVWWAIERDFSFPPDWTRVTVRRSGLRFAWGPSGGTPLKRLGAIEFAISAGAGGKGSVWIDNLRFESRPPRSGRIVKPKATASTTAAGTSPANVLDTDPSTEWRSGSVAAQQWLDIDFGEPEEFGGLVIDWDPKDYATAYRILLSDDGGGWTEAHASKACKGKRDYIYLHGAEARRIRIELDRSRHGAGYAIRGVDVRPVEFSASPNDFFAAIAAETSPGTFPKYLTGRQTYWTLVGVAGDTDEGLMNEEGALEVGRGAFTIEPFVYVDGELVTWAQVATAQSLERGDLPIPSVTWTHDGWSMTVTAVAAGPPDSSMLYARYRIENQLETRRDFLLFLALRPFQVLPPWQSLNMIGGVTPIRSLTSPDNRTVWVNTSRPVVSLTPAERFGAATFEEKLVSAYLQHGRVPSPRPETTDPFGYAAGALEYRLSIDPHASSDVVVAIPFHPPAGLDRLAPGEAPTAVFDRELAATVETWKRDVDRVALDLPGEDGGEIARTVKSTLAYIQVNRDGTAIQPGSRNYARSWMRDGAFTSSALLQFAHVEPVRAFLRWFADHQLPDGRIPCCIDRRGADRVPENDSNGEFLFALGEDYRYTHDIGLVWELWQHALRAVEFIARERGTHLTPEYDQPDKLAFRGLLPASISHEGYSALPVHSYWDDFFALRGLKDAVQLAVAVGDSERAAAFAALRDAFDRDLHASITRTIARHSLDILPASAELGDFDPTSTAVAISPVGDLAKLPQRELTDTFDRYLLSVRNRDTTSNGDTAYTPYELRNVDALIQMGRRDDAFALLTRILADRRPRAWNQWAEVVWHDPSLPRFIGDMPHTWVGSCFLRSVRSMLAYERESDESIVLGAGLPASWVLEGPGVGVKRLPTPYGVLHYRIVRAGPSALRWTIEGDVHVPRGGLVLQPPLPEPLTGMRVNGAPSDRFTASSATVRELPADVVLEWAGALPTPGPATRPAPTFAPSPLTRR